MNIKEWAKKQTQNYINDCKFYIDSGMSKDQALKTVLDSSTLGAGYKAQIEYELKNYTPKSK